MTGIWSTIRKSFVRRKSYETETDDLVKIAEVNLSVYPDDGSPLRRNARKRMENALNKLKKNRDNDTRALERAIRFFDDLLKTGE